MQNKKLGIYDKNIKTKHEIPISLFSFLFSEIVQYILSKSNEDKDFDIEEKLSSFGYSIVKLFNKGRKGSRTSKSQRKEFQKGKQNRLYVTVYT
jgi:hypothetical protein